MKLLAKHGQPDAPSQRARTTTAMNTGCRQESMEGGVQLFTLIGRDPVRQYACQGHAHHEHQQPCVQHAHRGASAFHSLHKINQQKNVEQVDENQVLEENGIESVGGEIEEYLHGFNVIAVETFEGANTDSMASWQAVRPESNVDQLGDEVENGKAFAQNGRQRYGIDPGDKHQDDHCGHSQKDREHVGERLFSKQHDDGGETIIGNQEVC